MLDPGPIGFEVVAVLNRGKVSDAALLRLRLDHGPALEHDLDQRELRDSVTLP